MNLKVSMAMILWNVSPKGHEIETDNAEIIDLRTLI